MIGFTENIQNGKREILLDKYQREAVYADSSNTLIVAPAGAGKTHTLIEAIIAYRKSHPGERICAITYTRAARAEMEDRIAAEGFHDIEITTIHVWSRNLLTELSKKYDFKIKLLEEPAIKDILKRLILVCGNRIKPKVDILYSYVTGNKKMDVSDNYLRTLDSLNKQYIHYKRTNGLYDFTDYPLYLLDMLISYNEIITSVDALFVDELQDVDSDQLEVFDRVVCNKKFYIGDPKQSIYMFRGASKNTFKKLKNFEKCNLKYNYRSCQPIIDYADTVYEELLARLSLGLSNNVLISNILFANTSDTICARGNTLESGDDSHVYVTDPYGITNRINYYETETQEAFSKLWYKMPMILCRTNKQVKEIENIGYYNVSTVHQAKGLEYNNVIVVDEVIKSIEDLNIAYVAITRARDNVWVVGFFELYKMIKRSVF